MFVEKHEPPILMLRFSRESCGFRNNETNDKTRQNICVACAWYFWLNTVCLNLLQEVTH